MTSNATIRNQIESIAEIMDRYRPGAYFLVLESLESVLEGRPADLHVSAEELLNGIRDCAMERFGPLAKDVLNSWGVTETLDFGQIVFQLVEADLLRRRPEDRLADFCDRFDFDEVFDREYLRTRFVLRGS